MEINWIAVGWVIDMILNGFSLAHNRSIFFVIN